MLKNDYRNLTDKMNGHQAQVQGAYMLGNQHTNLPVNVVPAKNSPGLAYMDRMIRNH